jgi:hypothetical protein
LCSWRAWCRRSSITSCGRGFADEGDTNAVGQRVTPRVRKNSAIAAASVVAASIIASLSFVQIRQASLVDRDRRAGTGPAVNRPRDAKFRLSLFGGSF